MKNAPVQTTNEGAPDSVNSNMHDRAKYPEASRVLCPFRVTSHSPSPSCWGDDCVCFRWKSNDWGVCTQAEGGARFSI